MIPASSTTSGPATSDEALRILTDREGEAKLLSGGYSLIPLLKLRLAQPALLVDLRRRGGPRRHRRDRRRVCASAPGRPTARSTRATIIAPLPAAPRRAAAASATRRSATGARSAAPSPTPTRRPTGRRSSCGQRHDRLPQRDGERGHRGARLLPRHVQDRHRADRGPDRDPLPPPAAGPGRRLRQARAQGRRLRDRRRRLPIADSTTAARIEWAGIGVTGVSDTPFAATDAEAVLAGNAPSDELFRRAGEAAGRPEPAPSPTSAAPSTTSGPWSPSSPSGRSARPSSARLAYA